jgi:outer membrane protein assembly factor BamB
VTARIKVGSRGRSGPGPLAVNDTSVLVGVPNRDDVVVIDAATATVTDRIPTSQMVLPCGPMVPDAESVWVASCWESEYLARLNVEDGTELTSPALGGYVAAPHLVGGTVWTLTTYIGNPDVSDDDRSMMTALDRATAALVAEAPLKVAGDWAVAAHGAYWFGDVASGDVHRIPLEDLPDVTTGS